MKNLFKLGEMFCGPGGIALAAKRASIKVGSKTWRIDHTWAIDNDEDTCKTFTANISPLNPQSVICKDVRAMNFDDLESIDAFAFGFPCNDFSVVGEQRGLEGQFGPLYKYGVSILNKFSPAWFLAENVGGLRSLGDGEIFKTILNDLRSAGNGYRLTTHLYKFEDYGVPQCRHRIIIIGIRNDFSFEFKVPAPTHLNKWITAREALEVPPIPENANNQEYTKQSPIVIERLKHILPGQNAWTAGLPTDLQLNVKSARLSHIYKRLDPDRPSYTVTGSGGGGTHVYHWSENRALTNRERARLQTFPDDFVFCGSKESVRRQIGMAVPPVAAQVLIECILKTFTGVKYDSISPNWCDDFSYPKAKQLLLYEKKSQHESSIVSS